jgi:alkanesulfonate monooxygenase SsuD/methylene tetrahydromethanopterin reductase-like flavin-dependent oxidoreductase (luciferase family)
MATETIQLGTMVSNPNLRHPLLLAKDAMTIDHLSNGRMNLGLGAGGKGFDTTVLGQPPATPAQRMDRLVELTELVDGLLRGTVTDHDGPWYTVEGARLVPGCIQQPRLPLLVAGNGRRGIDLAARVADGWISYVGAGNRPDPDVAAGAAAGRMEQLDRRCDELGRDPSTLRRFHLVPDGIVGEDGPGPLASVDAFVDHVDRCRRLGFTDVVFHHPRPDDPEWQARPEIVDEIAAALLEPPDLPD